MTMWQSHYGIGGNIHIYLITCFIWSVIGINKLLFLHLLMGQKSSILFGNFFLIFGKLPFFFKPMPFLNE